MLPSPDRVIPIVRRDLFWMVAVCLMIVAGGAAQAQSDSAQQVSRFPSTSTPVVAGELDRWRAYATPMHRTVRVAQVATPALTVWVDATHFDVPEPVDVFAHVARQDRTVPVASMRGTLVDDRAQDVVEVVFRDDGVAPDVEAGDHVYSLRIDVPPSLHPSLGAHVLMVRTVAEMTDGTKQRVAFPFSFGRPAARLTGTFHDRLVDGNVVITAELEVETEARFYLEGVIQGSDGVAIGKAHSAGVLTPGRRQLSLSFFGLMFVQRQLPGPYVLGKVMLRTMSPDRDFARGPVLTDAHTTAAYALDDLNQEAFTGTDAVYVAPVPPYESSDASDR